MQFCSNNSFLGVQPAASKSKPVSKVSVFVCLWVNDLSAIVVDCNNVHVVMMPTVKVS